MLQNRLFIDFVSGPIVLAHHHGKLSARITEDGGSIDTLNAFQKEGTPGTGTIREGLMLSQAICVPRHIVLSESGQRHTSRLFAFAKVGSDIRNLEERAVLRREQT